MSCFGVRLSVYDQIIGQVEYLNTGCMHIRQHDRVLVLLK